MTKNILILAGSPRKGGNSDTLAEAFAAGALENGHQVKTINVCRYQIGGCIACEKCWTADAPCILADDMSIVYPAVEEADTLALATPLYYFGFSGQLKAVIDRFYPYSKDNCQRKPRLKEAVLLVSAAGEEESSFAGLRSTFEIMLDYLGWQNKGVLIAEGVWQKGDVLNGDWLKKARLLGKSI